jgi:hypothetical protein
MRIGALVIGLVVACGVLAHADPTVAIRTDATPREITIGDQIAYRVQLNVSSDVAVAPFSLPSPFGDFETIRTSSPTIGTDPATSKIQVTLEAIITTFSTGTLSIPSLNIPIAAVGGASSTVTTEAISIHVRSLLAEKGDEGHLRPLKGVFSFRSYAWIWWTIFGVAAVLLALFVWKRKTVTSMLGLEKTGPKKPPEQNAWEALHALEDSDLLATGQHKEFYFRLSVILRRYLEERYAMSALDKTSSELLLEFRRTDLRSELVSLTRAFFDNADLVKFAKLVPTETEIVDDLNRVKQFVNATTPQKTDTAKEETLPV